MKKFSLFVVALALVGSFAGFAKANDDLSGFDLKSIKDADVTVIEASLDVDVDALAAKTQKEDAVEACFRRCGYYGGCHHSCYNYNYCYNSCYNSCYSPCYSYSYTPCYTPCYTTYTSYEPVVTYRPVTYTTCTYSTSYCCTPVSYWGCH